MLTCILDGKEIQNQEILHDILTDSLQFPYWYGRNLDALYDCLTDMQEEAEIQFLHEDILKEHLGAYAESLTKAVRMAAEENAGIHVSHVEK